MGNALHDLMRPQNLYGLQPNILDPRPLQFQPLSGNPLVGGDLPPLLWNSMLNPVLPTLGQIPQNVNNNSLWATGLQNSPATDAFFNRPGGAAFENIRLPNNGQQDSGILQNFANLPILSDNRGIHQFLERHSEEFHLTNTLVQTLPATSLVHPSDGGNNAGIPIPKTSGDFPAESSIGRNYHDIGQYQPGPSALSTTATQTEWFDHFNPLSPVVPASVNSRMETFYWSPYFLTFKFYANPFDVLDDCGEFYVNHSDDGRATAFVDVDGLPEESSTPSQYVGSRIPSDEPLDNAVNRAQFTKELPRSNREKSGGFGRMRMNSLLVEQVRSIPQEQLTYKENAGSEDTTGTAPLQDSDLNNNPATITYVVGRAEQGAPETDMLPEVAERENEDGGVRRQ